MRPEEIHRQALDRTPFHARTAAACRSGEWSRWAGYAVVARYTEVEYEYFAVRNSAALFDLSPMVKYRISGPEAEACLNRLLTRDVARLRPGRVGYAVWCDDRGKVLDDGTVFRFAAEEFWLCSQERHRCWLEDSAFGYQVTVEDVSEQVAALALQGPTSCAVLRRLGLAGVERLRPFDHARFASPAGELTVSRTGYTGDLGYELWLDPGGAEPLWDALMAAGRDLGITPMGSRALDLARIEAGFIAAQTDFVPAAQALRPTRGRSPFELGLERLVDFGKGHFNGRRALLAERERGPRYCLVGLEVEGNKPARDALVYHRRRRPVGQVSSAMWSPTCKRNLALATLRRPWGVTLRDDLWVEVYVRKELKWERVMARCRVVPRPFYDPPRRRQTPPADC